MSQSAKAPWRSHPLQLLALTSIKLLAIWVDLADDELSVKEVGRVHLGNVSACAMKPVLVFRTCPVARLSRDNEDKYQQLSW